MYCPEKYLHFSCFRQNAYRYKRHHVPLDLFSGGRTPCSRSAEHHPDDMVRFASRPHLVAGQTSLVASILIGSLLPAIHRASNRRHNDDRTVPGGHPRRREARRFLACVCIGQIAALGEDFEVVAKLRARISSRSETSRI